jgi:nicotinamidase-related amidase
MAFPSFYQPHLVGTSFVPNTLLAVDEGRKHPAPPAKNDPERIALLLIDMQVDFIHADGALSVTGAIDDTRRTIEWIYTHLGGITTIAASLDSHYPIQIFSPSWWQDKNGKHPTPYTVITDSDVKNGVWQPLYEHDWSRLYVERLEEHAKKQLMIWPYHTLIGTPGHNLTPALYEAIAYHTSARQSQPILLHKGDEARTEHYSIFEPEVKLPDKPTLDLNRPFLELFGTHDLVYIAGQAKSHCVLESVNSIMRFFGDRPDIISKVRVLTDAMSSVYHPSINFDAQANQALSRFAEHGLTLITTQDGIG